MAEHVILREVGLRDGIQMAKRFLETERKREWAERLIGAGVREIELTSFVPPKIVPQFADADELAKSLPKLSGAVCSALVPNLKGAERALAAGFRHINYVLSVSEAHSQANVRRSTEEAVAEFERIVALKQTEAGRDMVLACGLATTFGCTLQGYVDPERVFEIARRVTAMGADELIVADTVGYGNPAQVHEILPPIVEIADGRRIICHFHDTRGLGLANVAAALEAGVRVFDSSLAGLGGCPFAPGATGNINTEDTAYMLESMGFSTGADIQALLEIRRDVEAWLGDEERYSGAIARAGLPKTFSVAK
ncbi:hydroxymethylglutaryl-CoA lyase [Ochrobactrum daejeonense]|uniref:Hydroxymethylglutaryl-CoA lyase n=1 Tax=Brucella daejeonensis TaxID=659015 RepID=A0A7W9AWM9_9HYPH|nr:hydroxymethylglutaryl-CoA lyase [Brucella daejeonensis]MBB5701965.1 hydroxymethylglutaryl-CoA lyase [Brucella daejeonensis]NKB80083.1 hydroxymethylglutaryl-CoA lyase [Brucella daejeonensis]